MPAVRSIDDLITIDQAAEILGVHHTTVRRYIVAGVLPAHRFGRGRGLIRIRKADLSAIMRPIASAAGNGAGR